MVVTWVSYEEAFDHATRAGHSRVVQALVEEGGLMARYFSMEEGGLTVDTSAAAAEAPGRASAYVEAMVDAAGEGHTGILRALVEEGGVEVGSRAANGYTALVSAALWGQVEAGRMLVTEWGADVHQLTTFEEAREDITPLFAAAASGHTILARVLIQECGADPNQATMTASGATPLHIAAHRGRTELARMLVVAGARIDQLNNDGHRPLHLAAHRGHHDVCFVLCALGADMDLSLPEGAPPIPGNPVPDRLLDAWFDVARAYGRPLLIALERRDYLAAIHLLRTRQTDRPTARQVQNELLPIASTAGTHALARPVCGATMRVAEAAADLYSDRWSPTAHPFCREGQRKAVMVVLMIMRRAGQGMSVVYAPQRPEGRDEGGKTGSRVIPPHGTDEGGIAEEETDPLQRQVGGLPRWMHTVADDAWWKVLEMMGMSQWG